MVGYQKNDNISPNQKLFAGCISGVVTRFVTQPLDVVKLRTQLMKRKGMQQARIWRTTTKILKEEGITAFWHGHVLGQIHSVIAVSSQFYVYEVCTKLVAASSMDKKYKSYLNFLSGIFAGCVSATLVVPMEVIRVRQIIVKEQYRGLLNGAREVYRTGGVLAFYGGLNASLLQMGPQVGISFGVFRTIQPLVLSYLGHGDTESDHGSGNRHSPENLLVASTIAGSTAGFLAKTMTYPFDLAKRRLQISSHEVTERYKVPSTSRHLIKCRGLMQCIAVAYRKEGLRGLYRGWLVTACKSQLTGVVAFTTYELTCYTIRETNEY